ncbi:TIGR04141 family sporadically distributed protein [Amycolatopsis tucumanensis]|uniref:TIGR04141 family sporadically distributed protein n=2 Tax=Amycolatopsis tucumanensis TaxID=401106 RepID=A0ABP7HEN9_9PSEU
MRHTDTLRELVATKIIDDDEQKFAIRDVRVGSLPALLVSGESEVGPVEWTSAIRSLTGVDLGFTTTTASAALFLRVDETSYALTFGHGWRYPRDSKIDREFGLDVAVRLLDPDEIKEITRWALSAKARVDRNMVPGGQGLWAFGLREHAELVRNLTGKVHGDVRLDLAYVRQRGRYRNFSLSLECGDGLHIPLGIEAESLSSDLRALTRAVDELPVNDRLEPLRWVRRVPPNDDLREVLDSAAADLLADPDIGRGEAGIAYPARYYDGPTVHRYRGHIGDTKIDTDELTLAHLQEGVRRLGPDRTVGALRSSNIEGFDEDGRSLGGEVSALHWMAAEVTDPDYRHVLLDGEWYEIGEKYVEHVDRVISEAFANTPPWTLPPWNAAPRDDAGKVVEGNYNRFVADKDSRFLCLDKKLLKTRVHPRGFEACDLLGPGNVLVHVKKVSSGTGSSVLSHLFAQGLVAVESLTDRTTWDEFVKIVGEQDETRARELGTRPAGLVYAIHRSDKPLDPSTLFTFARSALVSASVTLATYDIPLQVCVIP